MNVLTDNSFEGKPRPTSPLSLMIFGVTIGAAIYFWMQEDYATASAAGLLGVALQSRYHAGAGAFLGLFAGGALAMVAAVPMGKAFEPMFQHRFGTQGLTNRLLSVGTVGTILVLIVAISVRTVARYLVRKQPRFQAHDQWFGLLCGGIQAGLVLLIMASGVITIEPMAREQQLIGRTEDRSLARLVSERVILAAETIRTGNLGPIVAACNPFEHIGPLKSLMQGVEVIRNLESLIAVAKHPAVEELYKQPVFQQTLNQLRDDPQLRGVLSSGEPITSETLSSLMENPAVLRLFDDREFVRTLTRVLAEIDPQTLLSSTSQP